MAHSDELFEARSHNAMFATILARLDEQDRAADSRANAQELALSQLSLQLAASRVDSEKRIGDLEKWKENIKGRVAVVALIFGGASAALWAFLWEVAKEAFRTHRP